MQKQSKSIALRLQDTSVNDKKYFNVKEKKEYKAKDDDANSLEFDKSLVVEKDD